MSVVFTNGPDEVIAEALILLGLASNPAPWADTTEGDGDPWPAGYASEMPRPDNVITCYETTPQINARLQVTGEQMEFLGITIRVRGMTKAVARLKAGQIRKTLLEDVYQMEVTIDGNEYLINNFSRVSLVPFGTEAPASKRYLINLNCLAVIIPLPYC